MLNWLKRTYPLTGWQLLIILMCSQWAIWFLALHVGQDEVEKCAANVATVVAAVWAFCHGKKEG